MFSIFERMNNVVALFSTVAAWDKCVDEVKQILL